MIAKSFWGGRRKRDWLCCDYAVEQKKVDMRTRFCKRFKESICDLEKIVATAEDCGMRLFWNDGVPVRVLAPDAKTARAFLNEIKRMGWQE